MLSVVRSEGNMPDVRGPEYRPVILIIFLSLSKKWHTQSADQAAIVLSVKARPASLKCIEARNKQSEK